MEQAIFQQLEEITKNPLLILVAGMWLLYGLMTKFQKQSEDTTDKYVESLKTLIESHKQQNEACEARYRELVIRVRHLEDLLESEGIKV